MTKEQTKQLLSILKVAYPQSFKGWDREQAEGFINLWSEMFKEDDANLVVAAVKQIILTDTREFTPNIAQVREVMTNITHPNQIDEHEAWNCVKRAISRSGWYSEEEFEKLPKEIQSYVGSPKQLFEWSQMDSDKLNTVVASNFMRNFKSRAKAIKEQNMLPNNVKNSINALLETNINVKLLKEKR